MGGEKAVIAVLIDALGWELVEKKDFLGDVLGYRAPVRTVLGYSSSAIPSILTGVAADVHNMWNLFYYSPTTSPFKWTGFLRFLPDGLVENRYTRYLVKAVSKKMSGYTGYFSCYGVPVKRLRFFDICEKKDIYRPGGIPGAPSIFDELQKEGTPFRVYSYHQFTDAGAFASARKDLGAGEAVFYFLYLSELDAFLHSNRHDARAIDEKIEWYGSQIRSLYDEAKKRFREVDLHVLSDHGMTEVAGTYDLISRVDGLGLSEAKDYMAIYDSTMARFWFFSEAAREKVTGLLEGLSCGRALKAGDMEAEGLNFKDNRYGDLIFLMDPGTIIAPSYMGKAKIPGMHGFHPSHPSSTASYFSNRPPARPVLAITDFKGVLMEGARSLKCGS